MKAAMICFIGLAGSWGHAEAEPLVEGRVLLPSGVPVPGAQVLLFDLTDLRAAPLAAATDGSGRFTLPLAALAGVLPERFEMGSNYPNPFNPSTVIPYQLPAPMHVRLEVFNLLGQRIATLVDGEQPAGFHTAVWDATDAAGQGVAAGVYLYRLSGDEAKITRRMLLIDGQAGFPSGGPGGPGVAVEEAGETAPVYGLTVSIPGLVPYVDPAFRVTAGMAPVEVVLDTPGSAPRAKAASGGILGDVDNTGRVDFFDALLVALYSRDSSIVLPNNGDISLGDVDADGQVDLSDAWLIAAWLNDPSDPSLPAGIGEPAGPAVSLSPDLSEVGFIDDGSWHRFTVQAGEPVTVVANPAGTPRGLEITTRSGRGNYCPAEADDDVSREDGQAIYLSGCAAGEATVDLRRQSDGTVLRTYTFEVTGSPADLVVESVSVSDGTLAPGQSFTLRATVRNQGTAGADATTLRWYRSSNRTISRQDTDVGTDAVEALAAAGTSAESISLTAPSGEGTYYYGACVVRVSGESVGNNCSPGVRVTVGPAGPTTGPAGDRAALVALYHTTDGPNWTDNTNWLSDRPLGEWHGVELSNGRVTGLRLPENQLTGSIPSELGNLINLGTLALARNQLTGPIPPQLAQLTNLWQLHLAHTGLTGEIPPELGQLTRLEYLTLTGNHLSGPIPPQLGQLSQLIELWLGTNRLTGSIPSELGNLKNLEGLYLPGNNLTGEIPPDLGRLTKLTDLHLAYNEGLSGPLPGEFTALPLESLAFEGTQVCVYRAVELGEWLNGIEALSPYNYCRDPQWDALSEFHDRTEGPNWRNKTKWLSLAPLGEWYGVTTDADGRVTELNLEDNNLSGILSTALGGLGNLKRMNLSSNAALSGPLPHALTRLRLDALGLKGTQVCAPPQSDFQAWLNGISSRTGVALCADTRVDYYALVELYNSTDGPNWTNKTGWLSTAPLDDWHGVTTDAGGRVNELNLRHNKLRGPISELGQLKNLRSLDLASNSPDAGRNELTGEIPPELGQLTNLSSLDLFGNRLTGEIPSELERLSNLSSLNLGQNELTGEIPPELGRLSNLSELELSGNPLEGEIPPELGQLTNLESLVIWYTKLSGTIPPGLGQLTNLRVLELVDNFSLTGAIPPELGQLTHLERLLLINNDLTGEIPSELAQLGNLSSLALGRNPQLTGAIPPELGQLANLSGLDLAGDHLTGEIPPELGRLTNLSNLKLSANQLTGGIPSELGQLTDLYDLDLSANQLTGEIPPQLGQLSSLSDFNLSTNQLTGEIPPELGQLTSLSHLNLSSNQLTGNIPPELADLGNLQTLDLAFNGAMSGTLPDALTRLNPETLRLHETLLCPPQDADFQAWLSGVPVSRIPNCARVDASTAYLTQATQSLEYPVPLVAGEAALLRVFVTAGRDVEAAMPPVRATFYVDGTEAHTAEIAGQAASIPWQISEGSLSTSANAVVPGPVVRPGLEMVVEIDPDQSLEPALGIAARLPATGRTAVNVRSVPPFDLTLIPFLWEVEPDRSVLTQTEGLSPESDLFRLTRDILPVGDFRLTVHEPVWTSVDPTSDASGELGPETELIYAMEGASGYYMAIFRSVGPGGLLGIAQVPGYISLSILDPNTIAHELGHNLSLSHSPGCGAGGPDPDYPYEDGSIGAWGYDLLNETLVSPGTSDLMTYCDPQWISEYSFAKALGHRSVSEAPHLAAAKSSSPPRGLLLWGGRNESGELFLEPAFVVSAAPVPPRMDGPYRLTGEDEDGNDLCGLPFGMPEYGCGRQGGSFAFILPVQDDWAGRLARIVLSGPEGVSILDGEEDPSAALLLDGATGKVRGVLRDWPQAAGPGPAGKRLAAPALPEPGLEVLTSPGLPDEASWGR